MAVNFYLDNRLDKKGDSAIRVSISIMGTRCITSTGIKVTPAKWDNQSQRARKGTSNASDVTWSTINSLLSRIESHFAKLENECLLTGDKPTSEAIRKSLSGCVGRKIEKKHTTAKSDNMDFWACFEQFIQETSLRNQWTRATHQKMNALKKHLLTFYESQLPEFTDWNEDGFNRFILYLKDVEYMKNSTIGNQISFLKWFLRWAAKKGYNKELSFQNFQPRLKTAQKQVVFLEWDELMTVFNYKIPQNGTKVKLQQADGTPYTKVVHDAAAIAKTRDIFCFCCFTSLRYSDASNLKVSNIHGDSMTITTIKTADTITIEFNKYAQSILKRYLDHPNGGGYVFPRITNQRMNIYVKELCELCGINRPITQTYYRGAERIDETSPKYELIGTHTGRRTFICNALMLGIPAEIVMKWTGHSDYKAMKPYIDVANSAKAKAMDLFNQI